MAELSKLGKYEIRGELGRGAMGVVYEGYDPSIKRVVALKTIRADQLAGEDAAAVIARFRREAQAAGRLNHPNIVSSDTPPCCDWLMPSAPDDVAPISIFSSVYPVATCSVVSALMIL